MNFTQFLELFTSLTVQATIVVATTYLTSRVIDSARICCRLWTICYVILLALVFNATAFPHLRLFPPVRPTELSVAAELLTVELQLGRWLFVAWLTGCLGASLLFIYRTIQAERFLRTCDPLSRALTDGLAATATKPPRSTHQCSPDPLVINGLPVRIVSTPRAMTPFCWQFSRPWIVLPAHALTLEPMQIHLIIQHELTHLRTGHPLQLFLQRLVEILFWFHPMLWWAANESSLARELMCDESTARSKGEVLSYLKTLLAIAENTIDLKDRWNSALSLSHSQTILSTRVRRLLEIAKRDYQQGLNAGSTRRCVAFSVALLLTMGTLASQLWMPVNLLASPAADWSPWPS